MSSTSETPSTAPSTSTPSKPPQAHSTGDRWQDFKLAVKRISFWEDLKHIGDIPCARNSLLSGIASGAGIGVIRGLNTGVFVASNWAVGTFLVVSLGTWNICRANIQRERQQVQSTVHKALKRRATVESALESSAENTKS